MEDKKVKQTDGGRWKLVAGVLALVSLGLLVVVIVLAVQRNSPTQVNDSDNKDDKDGQTEKQTYKMCGSANAESNIDTSESNYPDMYDDLTMQELLAVEKYMYRLTDMKIMKPTKARVNSSYIYISDLQPPNKAEALASLAGTGPKPDRVARLVVFRGDANPPVVEEYLVGPLPNPTWHRLFTNSVRRNPVPYAYRPLGSVEFDSYYDHLLPEVDAKIGHIVRESYGATFTNCGDRCIGLYEISVGSGVIKSKSRKNWLGANFFLEYYTMHPLDLMFLVNLDSTDPANYYIENILYAGREYSSLDELAAKYNASTIPKSKIPYPVDDKNLYSSMHRRGEPVPKEPKRAPRMYEPDGKRYSVKHRTVEYMQWRFNFRMSTLIGPQLYDIRFNNERIAYEVGLQEISVFYSANNSANRMADFIDSGELIGTHSESLVPGADCPETSTFIDLAFLGENSEDRPVELDRAFCLFELNSGTPLRRHLSYAQDEGGFYSGISDNVLILRSILTIVNYDYIVDFIFHQNGALEVKAMSTGYIFATNYNQAESPYGFQIYDKILGNIHHHMFLFKADIDIHGTSNRYETLDITTEGVQNEQTTKDPSSIYSQIRFDRQLKQTEMEAAYKYNFDHPKYHIIHNQQHKSNQGELKGYRIDSTGMTKLLLPQNEGNEPLLAWARYQMTVTKFKDGEVDGSTCYGLFDSLEPTINFTTFIADNDNIVDEDLVFWIPIGMYHIPHTEDIPVTATAGAHLAFTLHPYNYFPECPSSQSRDSIRVEYKDKTRPAAGVRVERYGTTEEMCVARGSDLEKTVEDDPGSSLEFP